MQSPYFYTLDKKMVYILFIISCALTIYMAWRFSPQRAAKIKKLEDERKSKLEGYARPTTGYKNIIHDYFNSLFYSLGLTLFAIGIKMIVPHLTSMVPIVIAVDIFVAIVLMSSGLILLLGYKDLSDSKHIENN
jgi:hypothetical protein